MEPALSRMEATHVVTSSAHSKSAGEIGQTTAFIPDILCPMIINSHFLLRRQAPEADRGFFHDVPGFGSVDVGEGCRISAMLPAEADIHPRKGEVFTAARGTPTDGCRAVLEG